MPAEGIFIENVLFAEMPSSVNQAGRTATEIAGGFRIGGICPTIGAAKYTNRIGFCHVVTTLRTHVNH